MGGEGLGYPIRRGLEILGSRKRGPSTELDPCRLFGSAWTAVLRESRNNGELTGCHLVV